MSPDEQWPHLERYSQSRHFPSSVKSPIKPIDRHLTFLRHRFTACSALETPVYSGAQLDIAASHGMGPPSGAPCFDFLPVSTYPLLRWLHRLQFTLADISRGERMDGAALRVFEAVARLGGMNRAAAELFTVQSNVTARIRQLEEELQATLFVRHSRGATLTAAGQRLLPYARQVAQLLDEAQRAVMDTGRPSGPLTLGSLETTAAVRLPRVLSAYAAAYPAVDLVLLPGTTAELTER